MDIFCQDVLDLSEFYTNSLEPIMLENLTQRLSGVIKTLRGQARLSESNIQDALREVRMALLEADVALPVVKEFIAKVKEGALGQEVIGNLNPGPGTDRRRASRTHQADGRHNDRRSISPPRRPP